jgi:hypothetical protein
VFHPECQIVSAELWQQANDMAVANAKASPRRSPNPRLLKGLIRCTRQHARVESAAMFAQQKPGRTPTYACKHRPYVGAPCCNLKVPAEPLEEAVWQLVQDIALEPEKLLADFVTACERIVAEQRQARARLEEARAQLAKWEDTIDRLSLAHYASDLPADEYRRVRALAESQRAQAHGALARLEQETGEGAEPLGGLADLLRERVESTTRERSAASAIKEAVRATLGPMRAADLAELDAEGRRRKVRQLVAWIEVNDEGAWAHLHLSRQAVPIGNKTSPGCGRRRGYS